MNDRSYIYRSSFYGLRMMSYYIEVICFSLIMYYLIREILMDGVLDIHVM